MANNPAKDPQLSWYSAREPLIIMALSAAAIAFFFAVLALSKFFDSHQSARADEYFQQGTLDLRNHHPDVAVNDFHAALIYSRDSYATQLSLAQALLALNRTEEALQYLTNLWQREPENGMVNFELARIYAEKGDVTQALRYYHNAIYAIWNQDQDPVRRSARLELINFLFARQLHGQAESELIAFQSNLPQDPELITKVGGLFMQVPDYQRALELFVRSLKLRHQAPDALAGAGQAAFELGQYKISEHYLKSAVAANPSDTASAQLLQTARLVIQIDPYNMRLSASQRSANVKAAVQSATARLSACIANTPVASSGSSGLQTLNSRLSQLRPKLRKSDIASDTVDEAMSLVFDIEQQTKNICGPPTGRDLALLLISREQEGN
jgi:tetratricopeptide (TPR) repeat protein